MSRRVILWSAAAAFCLAAVLVPLCCQRRHVDATWSPERLHAELERAGHHYVARPMHGGLLLKRANDPIFWGDLQELLAEHPAQFCRRPGCLYVASGVRGSMALDSHAGAIQLRHLFIRGHPDDLQRVIDAVGD